MGRMELENDAAGQGTGWEGVPESDAAGQGTG